MPPISIEDFDRQTFGTLCIGFGIPLIIVFIAWILIIHFAFKWRPFLYSRLVIAKTLKKDTSSAAVIVVCVLWWIFFAFPFVISIAFGVTTAIIVKPVALGVIIATTPSALILLLLTFMNYSKNGYRANGKTLISLASSLCILVAIAVVVIFIQEPILWRSTGYIILWPPLLFFAFSIASSRRRLKQDSITTLLKSDKDREQFSKDLEDGNLDEWISGNGKIEWYWALLSVLFSLLFNGIFIIIWHKDLLQASLGTALASLVIDIMVIVSRIFTTSGGSSIGLLFIGYFVKMICVTFSERFWFVGHGVIYFVIGTFFLTVFMDWLQIIIISDKSEKVHAEVEGVPQEIQDIIERLSPDRKHPRTAEAFLSLGAFILLTLAVVLEIVFYDRDKMDLITALNNIEQTDAVIALIVFTIGFALCLSVVIDTTENKGKITIPMLISFIIGNGVILGFFMGFKGLRNITDFSIIIFFVFFFIFTSALVFTLFRGNGWRFKPETGLFGTFSDGCFFVLSIILIIDAICMAVIPIFLASVKTIGVICLLAALALELYVGIVTTFLNKTSWKVIGALLGICLASVIGFCGVLYSITKKWEYSIIVFGVIVAVMLYLFALLWTRHNNWDFSLGPMLVVVITSLVILILSVVSLFLTDFIIGSCIAAFISSFLMFASLAFYSIQRNHWHMNVWSIISLSLLVIFAVAVIVALFLMLHSTFVSVTITLAIIFIICFFGAIGFLSTSSKTDVLVISNIFFPVRRYTNGILSNLTSMAILVILAFLAPWLWGLLASVFFVKPEFGALVTGAAFAIIGFLIEGMITSFDNMAFSAIEYIGKSVIDFALDKAIRISGTTVDEDSLPECGDTYESVCAYESAVEAMWRDRSYFMSSLKAQIYISAEVSFEFNKEKAEKYLIAKNADTAFLKQASFTSEERRMIFKLCYLIDSTNANKQDQDDYDDFVKKQEEDRQKKLLEMLNDDTNINKSEFSQVIANHQGKKYDDPDFYPAKTFAEDSALLKDCTWKRAEEIYETPMIHNLNPNDLCQGSIGDCYLIAAMSAISRKPDAVAALFEEPTAGVGIGAACVNFVVMNRTKSVIVDSNLPIKKEHPRFVEPREGSSWWFTMVEKAFAKLNGSYQAIVGGNSHTALYRLTGGAPHYLSFEDLEVKEMVSNGSFWNQILNWFSEGAYMCCGSHSGSDTNKNDKNIVQGHAYSILNVVEVEGYKLIKLRNPWGETEWTGDWGDNSPMWTKHPSVAKKLNYENSDDGVFWIQLKDFVLNYSSFYVCEGKPAGWYETEIRGRFEPNEADGSKPVGGAPPADSLKQHLIRFTKETRMKLLFEKIGGDVPCWTYMAYNEGSIIQKIYKGTTFRSEAFASNSVVSAFEWEIGSSDVKDPWTILCCRNAAQFVNEWILRIWTNNPIEVTEIQVSTERPNAD